MLILTLRCFIDPTKFGAVQHAFRAARQNLESSMEMSTSQVDLSSQGTVDGDEFTPQSTPSINNLEGRTTRKLNRMSSFPNDAETVPLDYAHPVSKYGSPVKDTENDVNNSRNRKREHIGSTLGIQGPYMPSSTQKRIKTNEEMKP